MFSVCAIMTMLWAFPIFHPPDLPLSQRNCFLTDCGSLRNLPVQFGGQEERGVILHNASRSPVSKGQRESNLSPALSLQCLWSQIYSVSPVYFQLPFWEFPTFTLLMCELGEQGKRKQFGNTYRFILQHTTVASKAHTENNILFSLFWLLGYSDWDTAELFKCKIQVLLLKKSSEVENELLAYLSSWHGKHFPYLLLKLFHLV